MLSSPDLTLCLCALSFNSGGANKVSGRTVSSSQHVFDEFLTYLSAVLSSPSAPKRQEFFGERVSPAAVRRLTTCLTTPVLADALKLVGIAASR